MNGSPAICSEKRVQRAHSTQRSRSSSTWLDRLIGLGKVRLMSEKRVSHAAVGHRLVLQRAFAALVADRAVQRVVDQQQLHHAVLGLVGGLRGVLGAHHHALGDGDGAAGHRLALALDLDQALPARADRVEQRVVAEPRDLHAQQFGGANHQRALGNRHLDVVDDDGSPSRPVRQTLVAFRCLGASASCEASLHSFRRGQHRGVRVERAADSPDAPRTRRGRT